MLYFEKLRVINLFSRSLIFFSFLLNLSVAIFAYYCLAWIYIQRGFVEGGVLRTNITDFYLSHYPQDLHRLIDMSRHLEESVNMSQQQIYSFGRFSKVITSGVMSNKRIFNTKSSCKARLLELFQSGSVCLM